MKWSETVEPLSIISTIVGLLSGALNLQDRAEQSQGTAYTEPVTGPANAHQRREAMRRPQLRFTWDNPIDTDVVKAQPAFERQDRRMLLF